MNVNKNSRFASAKSNLWSTKNRQKGQPARGLIMVAVATALLGHGAIAQGPIIANAIWISTGTGTQPWNVGTNWSSDPNYPSGIDATAIFFGPTASRSITPVEVITLGAIVQNNDTNSNSTIGLVNNPDGNGSFIFDADASGPATVTVNGAGTGNLSFWAGSVLTDSLLITLNQISATSAAGTLTWRGPISGGAGGLTKQGPGLLTLADSQKQYTGPTLFDTDSGRTRISLAGRPSQTSSVTVMPGAQIEFISNNAVYTLGPGPLNLNGTGLGPTSVPGNFPGAIRNASGLIATITNPVVLQSDTLIHVQNSATVVGITTLSGGVSGPGSLSVTAPNSNSAIGILELTGPGTFEGQTIINAGTLRAGAISGSALGGTSAVFVNTQATATGANGILELTSQNQINDIAPIFLNGGTFNTGGFSEVVSTLGLNTSSIIDLASGSSLLAFENSRFQSWSGTLSIFNWTGNLGVGGGMDQLFFGIDSTGLTAEQLDQIIIYSDNGLTVAGTGEINILETGEVVAVPEPTAIAMLLGGFGALLGFQRFRRMR